MGMNTKTRPKPERLTFPDIVVEKHGETLYVSHTKSGAKAEISASVIHRVLIRQLREAIK